MVYTRDFSIIYTQPHIPPLSRLARIHNAFSVQLKLTLIDNAVCGECWVIKLCDLADACFSPASHERKIIILKLIKMENVSEIPASNQ